MLLPEEREFPWWSAIFGAAGVGLAAAGIYYTTVEGGCYGNVALGAPCARRSQTAIFGGLLLEHAAPLLAGDIDAGETSGDAGPPDAGPPPAPTRVEVRRPGGGGSADPEAGLRVFFHDVDGRLLDTQTTDIAGRAESAMRGIDSVTLAVPMDGTSKRMYTVAGVGPAETTRFVLEPTVDVNWYRLPPGQESAVALLVSDGFATYEWPAGNADEPLPAIFPVFGAGAVAIIALDSASAAGAWTHALAFSQIDTEEYLTDWSSTFDEVGYSLAGGDTAVSNYVEAFADYEGRLVRMGRGTAGALRMIPGFPETRRVVRASAQYALGGGTAARQVSTVHADGVSSSLSLDISRAPTISLVSTERDESRITIEWSASGTTATDATRVSLQYSANGQPVLWQIVGPPGRATISIPAVPTSSLEFAIPSDEAVRYYVELTDFDDLAGYEAVRAQPLAPRWAYAAAAAANGAIAP